MYEILTQRDRDVDELARALNEYEFKETQFMNEINHYEKQVAQLSEELEMKDRELGEVTLERDSFKAETNWRRDESINSLS
jgi:chromosome segregation ATPase